MKLSKMSLRKTFGDHFTRSAFQWIDGEENIVGKFGRIAQLENGDYDIWFVGPNLEPLSARKISAIASRFTMGKRFVRLDGEAWGQGQGKDFVLRNAPLVGVKKRKRLSPETIQRNRERLARIRFRHSA